ncbi:MAG: alpha-ketoglutarate-dependent dioxygenase AlkB [Aureispira sp.]
MSLFPQSVLPQSDMVWYYPNFLSAQLASNYYTKLSKSLDWKQYPIRLFGKTMLQPRLIAWYGATNTRYKYAQTTLIASGWTTELAALQQQIAAKTTCTFNSVLANWYRNGQDSMGWHSDDEKELGSTPCIASISLGAARKLHFRTVQKPHQRASILLEHGSLLLMQGNSQQLWQHQIPKSKRVQEGRINLTFRQILTS